jgi:TAG lipase/steryl ester hydrolase/phospholipase A2/LPA acyltransferase
MFANSTKELRTLEQSMAKAESYSQWRDAAQNYDERSGAGKWRQLDRTKLYDYAQIRRRLDSLRLHRARQDNHALLFTLNEGIHGNMGGMGKATLYQPAKHGTKNLVEDYVAEIVDALEHIANLDDSEISREEKLDFFHRASHCYGRTALMLSGGGALGHFHIGVVKALLEQDLLPNVISGSSAGSLVTAIFGSHTTRELEELIKPVRLVAEAKEEAHWIDKMLFGKEAQIDIHDLEEVIERLVPDLTFQEAFDLTGRSINISVAPAELHQTSRLLNAIASPNVYIRRAVLASCAVPGVYPAVMLEAKNVRGERQPYLPTRRWVDGSVTDDLPAKRLSRLYGVNHYIASLINPIVLFSQGGDGEHTRIPKSLREFVHKRASNIARSSTAFSKRYSEKWPRFNVIVSMIASVLNQEYSADINVYPDFRKFDFRKILSHLTEDELLMLVRQGEVATWKQIDRIKTSTAISRTLDQILEQCGEEELRHTARKRKQNSNRANKTAVEKAAVTVAKKTPKKKASARKRPAKQPVAKQKTS